VDGWTVIPRWLYENDLPDAELQAVYVQQAEQKWRECVEARRDAEADLVEARTVEARAKQFLEEARAALRKYQAAAPAAAGPQRRALPKPRTAPRGG
jgi:chromosome segregation ATPase